MALSNTEMKSVSESNELSLMELTKTMAISTVVCAIGFYIEDSIKIKGADKIGTFLMQIFFAAIGASANIAIVVKYGPVLFLFAAIILFVHLLFLLTADKIFRLDLAELVIASKANMGGPTTAAAMAVARKWENLVIPAILRYLVMQ